MTLFEKRTWIAGAILCAALILSRAAAAQVGSDVSQDKTAQQAQLAFSQALPHLDGGHLRATIVEVRYGPGESSPPHSHPCPVIGYVVEGALRMQVEGQPEAIYKVGQGFYEAPNGIHIVSANASDKKPARFIAYFVCDHDTPLSVAPPEAPVSGRKP